jgi:hypothetical protein
VYDFVRFGKKRWPSEQRFVLWDSKILWRSNDSCLGMVFVHFPERTRRLCWTSGRGHPSAFLFKGQSQKYAKNMYLRRLETLLFKMEKLKKVDFL